MPLAAIGLYSQRKWFTIEKQFFSNLSTWQLAALASALALHRLLYATVLWASLPRLSYRRSFLASEIHNGCANSAVGGCVVGLGIKARMLRSAGFHDSEVAAAVLISAVAPPIALWLIATSVVAASLRSSGSIPTGLLTAGLMTIAAIGAFAMYVWGRRTKLTEVKVDTRQPSAQNGFVARSLQRLTLALRPICPRRFRQFLDPIRIQAFAANTRAAGESIVARRFRLLVFASISSQIAQSLIFLVIVDCLDPTSTISLFRAFGAFFFARAIGTLLPVPNGIGVLDVGLVAGLVNLGMNHQTAVVATALFRALTFLVPIVSGSLCLLYVRRLDNPGDPGDQREALLSPVAEEVILSKRPSSAIAL